MTKCLIESLLMYFPDQSVLSYDEFVHEDEKGMDLCSHLYDYDENLVKETYTYISRSWTEIYWPAIADVGGAGSDAWMLPMFLNKKSFIHSFPSLLNFVSTMPSVCEGNITGCEMLVDNFIDQLNLNEVRQEWKRNLYFSLDEKVKKIVGFILSNETRSLYAQDALDSYWCQFVETL
ncbi:hypothetical protein AGMMS49545_20700 [Betaproteobacteria bacterium]|nr:hypothetical protein AGMMS49545_20700 [Betaproteobacteria bacterium]GHU48063.1 hypothetical protein AGMMS50289_24170 [Betaproteobacteria bacterium]